MKKSLHELHFPEHTSLLVKEEKGTEFKAPFHFHQGYEFTYIVKGQGKFYGGNKVMNFTAGELYLFGTGFPHYFVNDKTALGKQDQVHSIFIQFKEDFLGDDFSRKPEFHALRELMRKSYQGIKVISPAAELQSMLMEFPDLSPLRALINLLSLLEKVSVLAKHEIELIGSTSYSHQSPQTRDKLELVYTYVMSNFKQTVNTSEAAAIAAMNESAFCRYFKRRTSKTLSQFVNTVRVTHATQLLTEKEIAISAVCFESGFNNLSYFNRQFKSIRGISPLAYRQAIGERKML